MWFGSLGVARPWHDLAGSRYVARAVASCAYGHLTVARYKVLGFSRCLAFQGARLFKVLGFSRC